MASPEATRSVARTTAPLARSRHALAYDAARGRTVLRQPPARFCLLAAASAVVVNVTATGTYKGAAAKARSLEALEDLLAFALFEVKNCLPPAEAARVLERVARMQEVIDRAREAAREEGIEVWLPEDAPLDPGPLQQALASVDAPLSHPAVQSLAHAAACLTIDGLKRAGRDPSRARLRQALESVRDFRTGVVGPLNYSRQNHLGTVGSAVVRIAADGRRLETVREWRTPQSW